MRSGCTLSLTAENPLEHTAPQVSADYALVVLQLSGVICCVASARMCYSALRSCRVMLISSTYGLLCSSSAVIPDACASFSSIRTSAWPACHQVQLDAQAMTARPESLLLYSRPTPLLCVKSRGKAKRRPCLALPSNLHVWHCCSANLAAVAQATTSPPESLLLLEAPSSAATGAKRPDDEEALGGMFLHMGLANGVLLRTEVCMLRMLPSVACGMLHCKMGAFRPNRGTCVLASLTDPRTCLSKADTGWGSGMCTSATSGGAIRCKHAVIHEPDGQLTRQGCCRWTGRPARYQTHEHASWARAHHSWCPSL